MLHQTFPKITQPKPKSCNRLLLTPSHWDAHGSAWSMFSLATRSDDSDGSAQRAPGGLGQLLLLKDADSVRLVIVTMGRGGFSSCSDVGTCSQKVNIVFLMGVELEKSELSLALWF